MKAILMSIRPEWVAKILNGEKTIEIRKRFPSDYVGWVYIYCTKDKKYANLINRGGFLTGMVVARFWCDKVEEINSCDVPFTFDQTIRDFFTDTFNDMDDLLKASCLDYYSLEQYLKYRKTGYAIHINDLEIFDEPKEISEFSIKVFPHRKDNLMTRYLTRAPQSYCFIEV